MFEIIDIKDLIRLSQDLKRIKDRYLAWRTCPEKDGHISHFDMCDIWQARSVYGSSPCNCGLLYDLDRIRTAADKIFPDYIKHSRWANLTWTEEQRQAKMSEEEKEVEKQECNNILKGVLPKANLDTPYQQPKDEADLEWEIIGYVFGKAFVERTKNAVGAESIC